MDQIILASSSKTRKELLESAGICFESQPAKIDEQEIRASLQAEKRDAFVIAEMLAEHKALVVSRKRPDALVIGADQILECKNVIFSKPESRTKARQQLTLLRDKEHRLVSSVVVAQSGERLWHNTDSALLQMRSFSDLFLDDYLTDLGEGLLDSPGCYRVEGRGVQLFARITGDYFTILGLPLLPLLDYLRLRGSVVE